MTIKPKGGHVCCSAPATDAGLSNTPHLERRVPAATVKSIFGKEAEKLAQRFGQLNAMNRERLLQMALDMISSQRDALLPARDRKIKKLIDRLTGCLDLLSNEPNASAIKRDIWREIAREDRASLAALGVKYFGSG
ncbi:MAG: hypothetical protein EOO77_02305 [Oxalobacteraceae bacterium]|nr:MAG: hypothetical protein EOO77_02305 [Oxalobacteraceae bacterium]